MKPMKRCLLLLCALGFAVGLAGCELPQSDMSPNPDKLGNAGKRE
ncbi:hypothetical protein [Nitrosococcus halophilus]|nr:hypothetical protein [Nitrosococcus halophilus]